LPLRHGLLFRRALQAGAHVREQHPNAQLREILARFAPPLQPWTRCPACNGLLYPVDPRRSPTASNPAPAPPTTPSPSAAGAHASTRLVCECSGLQAGGESDLTTTPFRARRAFCGPG